MKLRARAVPRATRDQDRLRSHHIGLALETISILAGSRLAAIEPPLAPKANQPTGCPPYPMKKEEKDEQPAGPYN